jgi:hypothetical protein
MEKASNGRRRYRPLHLERDRARPLNVPGPSDSAVEQRLSELIEPVTHRLIGYYHQLGLRERLLTLPIALAMIWRQVPSVAELLRTLVAEGLLWAPPIHASEQAFNQRLRCLPAELFGEVFRQVLPRLWERSQARTRPLPGAVSRACEHFQRIWVADASTLEEVCRKSGLLSGVTHKVLGGKMMGLLDLPSKLPIQLWLDPDPNTNENSFLDRVRDLITPGTLLIFDSGFHGFDFYDFLTERSSFFLTRTRANTSYQTQQILSQSPFVRDQIVALGKYRSNPCRHLVRRIEVLVGGAWHSYLTNVLDPQVLSVADAVDLYGRRWRIEEAFLLAKRLLGLSYLWKGSANTIALQVWATWLLYAVLIDLSDAVAQQLDIPLDQISVEMTYRGLYHFSVAHQKGLASDPVNYLASQTNLGIVKRRRPVREQAHFDKFQHILNL